VLSKIKMGRWGEELFAGDMDMDCIAALSADAGIELYYYKVEEGGESKGLEATRDHLNNGVLDYLFKKCTTYEKEQGFISKELPYIMLGVYLIRDRSRGCG